MLRTIFALAAFVMGLSQIQKEKQQMRFPFVVFKNSDCDLKLLTGWFRELRRLSCYPNDFEDRKLGLWGPERSKAKEAK